MGLSQTSPQLEHTTTSPSEVAAIAGCSKFHPFDGHDKPRDLSQSARNWWWLMDLDSKNFGASAPTGLVVRKVSLAGLSAWAIERLYIPALFLCAVLSTNSAAFARPLQSDTKFVLEVRGGQWFIGCDSTVFSEQLPGQVLGSFRRGAEPKSLIITLHQNGESPNFPTSAILGFYAVDNSDRTYIAMKPGSRERFVILGLSPGEHIISVGGVYILDDGSTVYAGGHDFCYKM